jgi:hypothetical protein
MIYNSANKAAMDGVMSESENVSVGNAQPKKTRARDPEFWIAIGALVVSAIAMLTSLMQVSLQRNQERALVWPHVNARSSYSGDGYAFVAYNKGLGPALVRDVQLLVDGKAVDNWNGALTVMLGKDNQYGWDKIKVSDLEQTILAANESVTLFKIPWDENTQAAFGKGNRISAKICYCSFLEECWVSKSGLDHQRVEVCPANK